MQVPWHSFDPLAHRGPDECQRSLRAAQGHTSGQLPDIHCLQLRTQRKPSTPAFEVPRNAGCRYGVLQRARNSGLCEFVARRPIGMALLAVDIEQALSAERGSAPRADQTPARATSIGLIARTTPLHPPGDSEAEGRQERARARPGIDPERCSARPSSSGRPLAQTRPSGRLQTRTAPARRPPLATQQSATAETHC